MLSSTRIAGMTLLAGCLVWAACATSPLGRRQLTLLPDRQMNRMGEQSFAELKRKKPIERGTRRARYVRCVAQAVAREARDETGVKNWEVELFKDKTANAFALPGGYIGVHTGILEVATNQDQLAAVLGHEVGHVIARHGNERVSSAVVAQFGMAVVYSFIKGDEKQDSEKNKLIMAGLGLGLQVGVLMPFGRGHESEADIIGQRLMAKSGFDPAAAIQLWENMSRSGGASPPEILSTHPSNSNRISALQSNLKETREIYSRAKKAGRNPRC